MRTQAGREESPGALLALVMVPQLILSLRLRPDLARVGAQID